MGDDSSKKSLKEKVEAADEEIKKLDQAAQERLDRQLEIDEEISVKSKLVERDIIEGKSHAPRLGDGADDDDDHVPVIGGLTQSIITGEQASEGIVGGDAMGATGSYPRPTMHRFDAVTLGMLSREVLATRYNANLEHKARSMGKETNTNIYKRAWAVTKIGEAKVDRMIHDLHGLEDRADTRIRKMNDLSKLRAEGNLSVAGDQQLRNLQKEEVSRYWIRQYVIADLPMQNQEKMNFMRPIGEGAFSVIPFTYMTHYNQLSLGQKKLVRWGRDNVLLRFQGQLAGKFIPKISASKWFGRKHKDDAESLLDDVDEDIYSDKVFAEQVKKNQAQLEDMEEELRGYDRFTVDEEKDIKKYVAEKVKEQAAFEKEAEWY